MDNHRAGLGATTEDAVAQAVRTPEATHGADSPPRVPSVAVPAIAAAFALLQATVLCALAARGSWYADDLDFLAEARAQPLGLEYLTLPVNDHLAPGLRLVYWCFAHGAPLDHGVTVVFRGALLLIATLLVYRLLVLLLGRRWVVLAPLAVYLLLPLTVPSFLSLSSAVNLLPSHIGEILLIDATVRYAMTRRIRHVVVAAAALAGALVFWEKSALVLGTAVVLVLGFLLTGSLHERLSAARGLWRLWAALLAVVVAAAAAWTLNGGAQREELASAGQLLEVARTAWFEGVGTVLAGGPWIWLAEGDVFLGIAAPGPLGVVAGQLAWLAVVVVGLRRTGRQSLLAWLMVAGFVVGTVVLVGLGRATTFGDLPGRHYHYWSDLAVTLTVALVCAWSRLDLDAVRSRALDRAAAQERRRRRTIAVPTTDELRVPVLLALALGLSAVVSVGRLEARWVQNPAGRYLATLEAELREQPGVAVYDTRVPPSVLSGFAGRNHVSDVVSLMDVDVRFGVDDEPHVVADNGRVVPGELQAWSGSRPRSGGCGYLLSSSSSLRQVVRLEDAVPLAEWTVRIGYLANPDVQVRAEAQLGPKGELVPLGDGARRWAAGLAGVLLRTTGELTFDRVVLTAVGEDVNVCVGDVSVGLPVAEGS